MGLWKGITGGFTALGKSFEALDAIAEAQKKHAQRYRDNFKDPETEQLLKNLETLGWYLAQHNKQLVQSGVPKELHLDIARIKKIVTHKGP